MKPLAVDLCHGLGGWTLGLLATGYEVIGVDVERLAGYPARQIIADVRFLSGEAISDGRQVAVVVASPPCEAFSRHDMPWTRALNPPPPDLSIWRACERLARELGSPLVLENVRGAQQFMGRAVWRWNACYLWGDGVPVLRQATPNGSGKEHRSGTARRERAMVPFALACWVGEYHYHEPMSTVSTAAAGRR